MRILPINPEPIIEIPFLNAGRGPGGFYEDRLPVLDALVAIIRPYGSTQESNRPEHRQFFVRHVQRGHLVPERHVEFESIDR